ncbi:hypothetical protein HW132_12985 [Brasilonema sp. CT11]|nr:hypothetical protein [Brasilonema sp. CT11]
MQERINTYDTPDKIGKVAKMPTESRSQESGGGSALDGFPGLKRLPFRSQESRVKTV